MIKEMKYLNFGGTTKEYFCLSPLLAAEQNRNNTGDTIYVGTNAPQKSQAIFKHNKSWETLI